MGLMGLMACSFPVSQGTPGRSLSIQLQYSVIPGTRTVGSRLLLPNVAHFEAVTSFSTGATPVTNSLDASASGPVTFSVVVPVGATATVVVRGYDRVGGTLLTMGQGTYNATSSTVDATMNLYLLPYESSSSSWSRVSSAQKVLSVPAIPTNSSWSFYVDLDGGTPCLLPSSLGSKALAARGLTGYLQNLNGSPLTRTESSIGTSSLEASALSGSARSFVVTLWNGSAAASTAFVAGVSQGTATSISLAPATLNMAVGGTQALTFATTPVLSWVPDAVYTSSNPAVATVAADGVVTALTSGTTTVTATTGGFTASSVVNVGSTLAVTISFASPTSPTFALRTTTGAPVSGTIEASWDDVLTIQAPTGYRAYRWEINGEAALSTSATLTTTCSDTGDDPWVDGLNRLVLVIQNSDGFWYSSPDLLILLK